jgi:alpha-methylacyl-CoA racemase
MNVSDVDVQPLAGVRVVTLAVNLPGPVAAEQLVRLGATVTKVEPPAGDPLAAFPAWYAELTAGQQVVVLDLKAPSGRGALEEHLAQADVLLTAMRPSALDRLGLDELARAHPRLVHVEIVGHGGARAEAPGHDLTYQAAHGTLVPPAMPTVPVADLLGAERAVSAAVAGLFQRTRTGVGGRHRVVLDEAARLAGAAVRHGLMGPGAPLGGALATYRTYTASDGHVALGALEPHFAARVAEHLGTTAQEIGARIAEHTTAHWHELGKALDIPLVAVHAPQPPRS